MKPRIAEVCPRCGYRFEDQESSWPGPTEGEVPPAKIPSKSGPRTPDGATPETPQTFHALIETMRGREESLAEENGEGESEESNRWRSSAGGEDGI